MTAYAVR